jgi:hypothetical protein
VPDRNLLDAAGPLEQRVISLGLLVRIDMLNRGRILFSFSRQSALDRMNQPLDTKMKKQLVTVILTASVVALFTGFSIGGGSKTQTQTATTGQQLIDLQKAKETGAITEAEYQSQKAKVLGRN